MAEFLLRTAAAGDEEHLLMLIGELAEFEGLRSELIADKAAIARHLFGPDAIAGAMLAEMDGQAVGFALWFRNFSTFLGRPGLYLEDLYVKSAYRGQGIGKALMVSLATLAHERSYGRMEWSVLNWNQPAIDFYESIGARPMSTWTVYRLDQAALSAVATGSGSRSG